VNWAPGSAPSVAPQAAAANIKHHSRVEKLLFNGISVNKWAAKSRFRARSVCNEGTLPAAQEGGERTKAQQRVQTATRLEERPTDQQCTRQLGRGPVQPEACANRRRGFICLPLHAVYGAALSHHVFQFKPVVQRRSTTKETKDEHPLHDGNNACAQSIAFSLLLSTETSDVVGSHTPLSFAATVQKGGSRTRNSSVGYSAYAIFHELSEYRACALFSFTLRPGTGR